MGAILQVRDDALRRSLAMKIILDERGGEEVDPSSGYVQRFLEEAQVTAQLDHPGVVPVHELGVDEEGRVFFTMKLVKGRTLVEIFERVRGEDEDWNLSRALQLLVRVCETLAFAHSKGVVHRDLKPANVMVGDFGEVYVMDWGLAKVLGESAQPEEPREKARSLILTERAAEAANPDSPQLTQAGDVIGTPAYMPLEQGTGLGLDARSDVYAIGALLYELLAGHAPYSEPAKNRSVSDILVALMAGPPTPIHELARKAPPELLAITEKALARDPVDRYQSAAELGEDLRHFIEGRVVSAYRTGAFVELSKWVQRNRGLAAAIALAVVFAIGGLVVSLVIESRASGRLTVARDEARDAAREARAQAEARARALVRARAIGLATASAEASNVDSMRALLLAREAVRARASVETVSRLRVALEESRERFCHPTRANLVRFSPKGDVFLTVHGARALLWSIGGEKLAELSGHRGWIRAAVFSAAGDRIVTASTDKTGRVWDRTGKELAVLSGHDGALRAVAFSPDGERIATASSDGTARLWDLAGKELVVFRGHLEQVNTVAFSPQGDRVLTGSGDRNARLWDLEGKPLAVLGGHPEGTQKAFPDGVHTAIFSPDGDRVLTASSYSRVKLWDRDGNALASPKDSPRGIASATFSPEGAHVLASSFDGVDATLWDREGDVVATLTGHGHQVCHVAFAPPGREIVTASLDGTARIWDLGGRELAVLRGHEVTVDAAFFSPCGKYVLTDGFQDGVRLWDRESPVPEVLDHRNHLYAFAVSPSGDRIVAGGLVGVGLWDRGPRRAAARHDLKAVGGVAFSPSGDRILTGTMRGVITLWSGRLGAPKTLRPEGDGQVQNIVWAPAGDRFLWTDRSTGKVHLWDLEGKESAVLAGQLRPVSCARFSPSGDRILTSPLGPEGRDARLWDLRGKAVADFKGHGARIGAAAFSPTGDRIVTASHDRTARLWDFTGKALTVFTGHRDTVSSAVFTPEGDRILTTSEDRTVRLWDLEGKELRVFRGHEDTVLSAEYSPTGDRILTVSSDRTARVWDREGHPLDLLRVPGKEGRLHAHFLPSGDHIVTGYSFGRTPIRVWRSRLEDLLTIADERVSREFTAAERKRYGVLLGDGER
jgi:WD40 repeat protein/tRNA A-37 threonylcarbamoyl transferase component Bud32